MRLTLKTLFHLIENPDAVKTCTQGISALGLFEFGDDKQLAQIEQTDIDFLSGYFSDGFNTSAFDDLGKSAGNFYKLSSNAFDTVLRAWLSELPIEPAIIGYGSKILAASQTANTIEEKRHAAQRQAENRSCADSLTALNAAGKVNHEVNRMMGLLRFTLNANGEFTAECEPDHFIFPMLAEYFSGRFGETAWSIIDRKRGVYMRRLPGETVKITLTQAETGDTANHDHNNKDEWEELWKHYHKTINNEDRNNPDLQKQFMPKRYWKYLPEKQ